MSFEGGEGSPGQEKEKDNLVKEIQEKLSNEVEVDEGFLLSIEKILVEQGIELNKDELAELVDQLEDDQHNIDLVIDRVRAETGKTTACT